MGIIRSAIKKATIDQENYLNLLDELMVAKNIAILKLVNDDKQIKEFIKSRLYYIFKSGVLPYKDRYSIYLKSLDKGTKPINIVTFYDLIDFDGDLREVIKEKI